MRRHKVEAVSIFHGELPEYKNPKEGRHLGELPDGSALPKYPFNYPLPAGESVEASIHGKTENEKTFAQCGRDEFWGRGMDLEEKQERPKKEEK